MNTNMGAFLECRYGSDAGMGGSILGNYLFKQSPCSVPSSSGCVVIVADLWQ
jgi:hypothetical protein